jgi:hypothetical protein
MVVSAKETTRIGGINELLLILLTLLRRDKQWLVTSVVSA